MDEEIKLGLTFKGPRFITFNREDGRASLRGAHIFERYCTIEPRLNIYAPYLPILLTLVAIDRAVNEPMIAYGVVAEKWLNKKTDNDWLNTGYFMDTVEQQDLRTRRGGGGYQSFLNVTRSNFQENPIFSPAVYHVVDAFLQSNYRGYIQRKPQSINAERKNPVPAL